MVAFQKGDLAMFLFESCGYSVGSQFFKCFNHDTLYECAPEHLPLQVLKSVFKCLFMTPRTEMLYLLKPDAEI